MTLKRYISILVYHLLASFSSIVFLGVDYTGYLLLKETHVRGFWDPGNNKLYGRTFLHHSYSFWLKINKSTQARK